LDILVNLPVRCLILLGYGDDDFIGVVVADETAQFLDKFSPEAVNLQIQLALPLFSGYQRFDGFAD
jgi:hypothetical protein